LALSLFAREESAHRRWATLTARAGKSVRWIADQLGHFDLALTLRVYLRLAATRSQALRQRSWLAKHDALGVSTVREADSSPRTKRKRPEAKAPGRFCVVAGTGSNREHTVGKGIAAKLRFSS